MKPENDRALKEVGYWTHRETPSYPQPQWLVQPGWHAGDLKQIIAYLRAGRVYASYMGYSFCRFADCHDDCRDRNGVCDFTDGIWVWPEGLAHYLEKHAVILPEEFVATMRANNWQIPKNLVVPKIETGVPMSNPAFWLEWSQRYQPRI